MGGGGGEMIKIVCMSGKKKGKETCAFFLLKDLNI